MLTYKYLPRGIHEQYLAGIKMGCRACESFTTVYYVHCVPIGFWPKRSVLRMPKPLKNSTDLVLMKSDPYEVHGAIELLRSTLRKMHRKLTRAVGYMVVVFPAVNVLLLRRAKLQAARCLRRAVETTRDVRSGS